MSFIFNTSFKRSISEQEKYSDTFLPETPDNQLKTENIGINRTSELAGWSKDKSLPELKASLETITNAVSGLISSIDKHFAEICKERGIDLTAQPEEPQRDTVLDEYPMPDQLFTAEELRQDYGYLDGDMLPLSQDRAAELLV